jgi:hypothetical protein
MAISIVSWKYNGNDDATIIVDQISDINNMEESQSSNNFDNSIHLDNDKNTISTYQNAESDYIEENIIEKEWIIPNMYIQSDIDSWKLSSDSNIKDIWPAIQENKQVENISTNQKENVTITWFSIDDLLVPNNESSDWINNSIDQEEQKIDINYKQNNTDSLIKNTVTKKKSWFVKIFLISFLLIVVLVVVWFFVRTMFPLWITIQTQETIDEDLYENVFVENTTIEEQIDNWDIMIHNSSNKSDAEIVVDKLNDYIAVATSFYAIWKELKDRDVIRYALYIQKKAEDILHNLNTNSDITIFDFAADFEQFDQYLILLREWQKWLDDWTTNILSEENYENDYIDNDLQINSLEEESLWANNLENNDITIESQRERLDNLLLQYSWSEHDNIYWITRRGKTILNWIKNPIF